MQITIDYLKKAKPENVIRLAKWLQINVEGINIERIICEVYKKIVIDKYSSLWKSITKSK